VFFRDFWRVNFKILEDHEMGRDVVGLNIEFAGWRDADSGEFCAA
jgi:hypothetical protein